MSGGRCGYVACAGDTGFEEKGLEVDEDWLCGGILLRWSVWRGEKGIEMDDALSAHQLSYRGSASTGQQFLEIR